MVGKLIKHDFKDALKAHLPVLGMIALGTVLALISLSFVGSHNELVFFLSSIVNIVIFGLVIAVIVLTIRASIYILYTSIYKNNSYRLFTLPVSSWKIIVSKVVTLFLWSSIIFLATLLSVGIIVGYVTEDFFIIFRNLGEALRAAFDILTPKIIVAFLIDGFLQLMLGYSMVFFAGSIANSSFVRKNRSIVTFVVVLITSALIGRVSTLIGADFITVMSRYNLSSLMSGMMYFSFTDFIGVYLFDIIISISLFLGTLWLWENKLEVLND